MRPDDLQGEARTLFEEWRAWGCTEAEALDLVERSGLLGGNPYAQQVYEASASFSGQLRVWRVLWRWVVVARSFPLFVDPSGIRTGRSTSMSGGSTSRSFVGRVVRGE